jgi:glycosyltransferase involved in cell wall biosynthesis
VRIAVTGWSNRRFGGAGTYLTELFAHLEGRGHELAFLYEYDAPVAHPELAMAGGVPAWGIEALGAERALDQLRAWDPDLVFAHGLINPQNEDLTLDVAPAVFFAHDYYGTCISGFKTHRLPTIQPCERTFGWQCLGHYFPRRCGGLSPVSMVREFRKQTSRLELLRRYRAIATHSERMRDEYLRHGFDPSRVVKVPYGPSLELNRASRMPLRRRRSLDDPWRVLFVGRMYEMKGGRQLIDALPQVARALQRPVSLTFVGEGAARREWEHRASLLCSREPMVRVDFTGWVQAENLAPVYEQADLVVMPSLWPEPLGIVGLEAGLHGVPVAAYAVGGITEWLRPGVNGQLADGNPPTVEGLAAAIIGCLQDNEVYAHLQEGARRLSQQRTFEDHLTRLLALFEQVRQAA